MPAHRRVGLTAVAIGIVLIAAAGLLFLGRERTADARRGYAVPVVNRGTLSQQAETSSPVSGSSGRKTAVPIPRDRPAHQPLAAASTLTISALGVYARIVQVGLTGSVMQVPHDPRILGWWSGSAGARDRTGNIVIVGHVDFGGVPGALASLPDAQVGDHVELSEPDRVTSFTVRAVRTYPKSQGIPGAAFSRDGPHRLVLITCGGPFDPSTGNYEDNIVVYAYPS